MCSGTGLFDVDKWEEYDYNLKDPVDRNTGWLLEGGWTAIRFRTDNPGIWLMHCEWLHAQRCLLQLPSYSLVSSCIYSAVQGSAHHPGRGLSSHSSIFLPRVC